MMSCSLPLLLSALSLVESSTYTFEWDARRVQYTCNNLQEQTGKKWTVAGDSCVHLSEERFNWTVASMTCASPSYSFSSPLTELSWLRARQLPETDQRYWTAWKQQDALSLTDGAHSTSIFNPTWADDSPTRIDGADLCVAIELTSLDVRSRGWTFVECTSTLPVACQTFACIEDEFRCADNTRCIPRADVNDGFEDCIDGSDESGVVQARSAAAANSRAARLQAVTDRFAMFPPAPTPERIFVDCAIPNLLRNVYMLPPWTLTIGSTLEWQCNAGFTPRYQQTSVCFGGDVGWVPSVECNELDCFEPDSDFLLSVSGTTQGDRANYSTPASAVVDEFTRVAVCDDGDWVRMGDEPDDICLAAPFKFGRFLKDFFRVGELMAFECEQGFASLSQAHICSNAHMDSPTCLPVSMSASECVDGTVQEGGGLFERDWCSCSQGGIYEKGQCRAVSSECTLETDECRGGRQCQKEAPTSQTFRCVCGNGTCLYPFDAGCAEKAVVASGQYDADLGECALLRCPIADLKAKLPTNCRTTNADPKLEEEQLRLGTTDVFCTHTVGDEQIQVRHPVRCEDGEWESADLNRGCFSTDGLLFDADYYGPFEVAIVKYAGLSDVPMKIRCDGRGQWMGEVPVSVCLHGQLKSVYDLVKCVCDDGYFGADCSSICDQGGTPLGDGKCQCPNGFHGDHCEIENSCADKVPSMTNGEYVDLVFILDLHQSGYEQFLTSNETGLLAAIQQLIRDISYYDGRFVRNIRVYTYGTQAKYVRQYTADWPNVYALVKILAGLVVDNLCTLPIHDVIVTIQQDLLALPRSSIVNIITTRSILPGTLDNAIFDVFEGLIVNVITDSSIHNVCSPSGGTHSDYARLTRLTTGFFLNGFSATDFMKILPRMFKSSVVLIPTPMGASLGVSIDQISLDVAAQTIIVYAEQEAINEDIFQINGSTNYDTFNLSGGNSVFQVLHNRAPEYWEDRPADGYFYELSPTPMSWQDSLSWCTAAGGTMTGGTANEWDATLCPDGIGDIWTAVFWNNTMTEWQVNYRGVIVGVIDEKTSVEHEPGADCAVYSCKDRTWSGLACKDNHQCVCQRPVFDVAKDKAGSLGDIRPDAGFSLQTRFTAGTSAFVQVRVQSNIVFDRKLTDENDTQVTCVTPGKTRVRMGTDSPAMDSLTTARHAVVVTDDTAFRSKTQLIACDQFPMRTAPLVCSQNKDLTVQIVNSAGGVLYSFMARCLEGAQPAFSPPPDCDSTGCIPESAAFCVIQMQNEEAPKYVCVCRPGYFGTFCEHKSTADPTTCDASLIATVNDVTDSFLQDGTCGCSKDLAACTTNRFDACDGRCSPYSVCAGYTDTHTGYSMVCDCGAHSPYIGEFCDRSVPMFCEEPTRCLNGATCETTPSNSDFKCICAPGFTGTYCDILLTLCTPEECLNGGTCFNVDPVTTFCLCSAGYTGERCERILDVGCFNGGVQLSDGSCRCPLPWGGRWCTVLNDPIPDEVCHCENDGVCVFGVQRTSCKCPENFVGAMCEQAFSYCNLSPCTAHGKCLENGLEYRCECDEGFAGAACQEKKDDNGCTPEYCRNGGTCRQGKCTCSLPFTGDTCDVTMACEGFCQSGGTCSLVNGKPTCRCALSYSGQQCEREDASKTYNIKIVGGSTPLGFEVEDLGLVFTICSWMRATPPKSVDNPVMPVLQMDFAGHLLRVTTQNATLDGSSLGRFDMRMREWQQFCVRCDALVCDAFANGAVKNIQLPSPSVYQSSPVLVIAPYPIAGEIAPDAELSRFSIFTKLLTPADITAFTFECASFIVTQGAADLVWWSMLDMVPRADLVTPGLCETSHCFPGACPVPTDKSPPVAVACPIDLRRISATPLSIEWPEPEFEDELPFTTQSNYRSGDIFTWGEHHVVYTATDDAKNTGRCEFDVYVAPNECTPPQQPAQGEIIYRESFDLATGAYISASVQCADPRFPLEGPQFYVCDYMGQWRRSYFSPAFTPPSCGAVSEPTQTMDGVITFNETIFNCDADREKVEAGINRVLVAYCPEENPACATIKISACPNKLAMQEAEDSPVLAYAITITSADSNIYKEVRVELEKIDGASVEANAPSFECAAETPLRFFHNEDTLCAEVPPGFYYDAAAAAQFECPLNQYQDSPSKTECIPCPPGTITESPGATKVSDCYQRCEAGSFCDFDEGLGATGAFDTCCRLCDKGRYSTSAGSNQPCQFCEGGAITRKEGSTSPNDCYWPCTAGEEVDAATGECKACEQGKYKEAAQSGQCTSCVKGLTTAGSGSASKSDCNTLFCPPNTYVNPAKRASNLSPGTFKLDEYCLPCGEGDWQPQANSTECTKCPDTPDANNELPATCRLVSTCSPDLQDNCGEGKKCVPRPDNKNYFYCVEDHAEEGEGDGLLTWWQITLIIIGVGLLVAIIVGGTVVVVMRCCYTPKAKKEEVDEDSLSIERRTTGDNFAVVPDKAEDLDRYNMHLPPVHVDPSYLYKAPPTPTHLNDRPLTAPPTPLDGVLPIEYQQRLPPTSTDVVAARLRKRLSNTPAPRQPRPFSTSSIPSLQSPLSRNSAANFDFYVPSVTLRSNSESSLDSFSVASTSSRGSVNRRPDSNKIVHALVDALNEDRFRGWDRESSIL